MTGVHRFRRGHRSVIGATTNPIKSQNWPGKNTNANDNVDFALAA